MKKIMIIGYGAMAQTVLPKLPLDVRLGWVVVMPQDIENTKKLVGPDVQVVSQVTDITGKPDRVIEMAGQAGLRAHIFDLIEKGLDIGVISVGTFADSDFTEKIRREANKHHARVYILSGAIAGVDGLASAKVAGLNAVTYQGRKNPRSWKGSHAEQLINLDEITEATTFFKGSAREAATLFPANANVAATLALAGVGMEETKVELIADPLMNCNQHKILAKGVFGEMEIVMRGVPLENNPKTSMLAALSVARFCNQLDDSLIV